MLVEWVGGWWASPFPFFCVKAWPTQVLYCYGANRKSSHPTRLVFSGVKEGSKTYEGLSKQSGPELRNSDQLCSRSGQFDVHCEVIDGVEC